MAQLPIFRRILREDVKDAPAWFDRVLVTVNSVFETLYSALSGNLTFGENIRSQIQELIVHTPATYTTGDFTQLNFTKTIKSKAVGLSVMQCIDTTTSAFQAIGKAVFCDWLDVNGSIQIYYVSGLSDSHSYNLRVLVY